MTPCIFVTKHSNHLQTRVIEQSIGARVEYVLPPSTIPFHLPERNRIALRFYIPDASLPALSSSDKFVVKITIRHVSLLPTKYVEHLSPNTPSNRASRRKRPRGRNPRRNSAPLRLGSRRTISMSIPGPPWMFRKVSARPGY